jgi:nucleotide-binding universal stress UspA family protein/Icc-related predicted phosphoesterase
MAHLACGAIDAYQLSDKRSPHLLRTERFHHKDTGMHALVLNTIAGRCDRLKALLDREQSHSFGAVLVLGNLLPLAESANTHSQARSALNGHELYRRIAPIVDLLGAFNAPVYLLPGEHDPSVAALSQAIQLYRDWARLHLIHGTAAYLPSRGVVTGFGGRLTTTQVSDASIQFPASEARGAFEHLAAYNTTFKTADRRIFLFGTPPRGSSIDLDAGTNVGVELLNDLIDAYQPHLVCCGGPASGRGVEMISGTQVINPGALADGSYAIVDLERGAVRLEQLPKQLRTEPAFFQSITVALDGSPQAWHGLALAAALARAGSGRLTLVYAFEPVRLVLGEPALEDLAGERIAEGQRLLETAANSIADLAPACEVAEGPAADAILRVAAAHHADLIVVGSRRPGSLSSILGSVGWRVLQHAPCPVLIARDKPQSAGGPVGHS